MGKIRELGSFFFQVCDGALAFRVFEETCRLRAVISTAYYPNGVAKKWHA